MLDTTVSIWTLKLSSIGPLQILDCTPHVDSGDFWCRLKYWCCLDVSGLSQLQWWASQVECHKAVRTIAGEQKFLTQVSFRSREQILNGTLGLCSLAQDQEKEKEIQPIPSHLLIHKFFDPLSFSASTWIRFLHKLFHRWVKIEEKKSIRTFLTLPQFLFRFFCICGFKAVFVFVPPFCPSD